MNGYISLKPDDKELRSPLKLIATNGFFNGLQSALEKRPAGAGTFIKRGTEILCALSASKTLLFTKSKDRKGLDIINLHIADGVISCVLNDARDGLLLKWFNADSLSEHNVALKYGVSYRIPWAVVQAYMYKTLGFSCDYVNGRKLDRDDSRMIPADAAIRIWTEMMESGKAASVENEEEAEEEAEPEEEYEPDEELAYLLTVAENYSLLSFERENNKVIRAGKIPYRELRGSAYNRTDRVAYDFTVDSLDTELFKPHAKIDVEDKRSERHTAEIANIEKTDGSYCVTALFSEHLDIGVLGETGWFTLSFSTVNRDVQLDAIEKIRTGKAPAKYMDAVLGRHLPAGFEGKDISELKENLAKKKYPPNESQVRAICDGINSKDVYLVMGPPGTGKTTVILEWVKYFVQKEHKRVLVSSQNNKAVDNVLSRIAEDKDIEMIRIAPELSVQSDVVPYLFENKIKDKREEIVSTAKANRDCLTSLISKWSFLREEASALLDIKRGFEDYVTKTVRPLFRRLNSLLQLDKAVKDEKNAVYSRIVNLHCSLMKARGEKNFFKKLFGATANLFRSANLKKQTGKYDSVSAREAQIVSEYNSVRAEYGEALEYAYGSLYSDYYYTSVKWKIDCAGICSESSDENIWGLFTGPDFGLSSLTDEEKLESTISAADAATVKAGKIKEATDFWKDTIGDTQNYALDELILDTVNLVGATCISVNSQKRFADLKFDVTIIDEAGQIQIHNALVPMSVSGKLIMLGDHKQIPPMADKDMIKDCTENDINTELLEKSLFEIMYESLPEQNKTMLDTQYRVPSEIAQTISEWFYGGRYLSHDSKNNIPGMLPDLSKKPYIIIDTSGVPGRYEAGAEKGGVNDDEKSEDKSSNELEESEDKSSKNELEASAVAALINMITGTEPEIDLSEVGVISAYKSQVKLIASKLADLGIDEKQTGELVATLDSFQGQERNLIIYSFTKSSDKPNRSPRIGFLSELRRLNVAMTRCKKTLILIGDMEFLSSCENCRFRDGKVDFENSEKNFSKFIRKMIADVKAYGEIIPYDDFVRRTGR